MEKTTSKNTLQMTMTQINVQRLAILLIKLFAIAIGSYGG